MNSIKKYLKILRYKKVIVSLATENNIRLFEEFDYYYMKKEKIFVILDKKNPQEQIKFFKESIDDIDKTYVDEDSCQITISLNNDSEYITIYNF